MANSIQPYLGTFAFINNIVTFSLEWLKFCGKIETKQYLITVSQRYITLCQSDFVAIYRVCYAKQEYGEPFAKCGMKREWETYWNNEQPVSRQPISLKWKRMLEWDSTLQQELLKLPYLWSVQAIQHVLFELSILCCGQNFESINAYHLSIDWTLDSWNFRFTSEILSIPLALSDKVLIGHLSNKFNYFKDISHFNHLMSVIWIFNLSNPCLLTSCCMWNGLISQQQSKCKSEAMCLHWLEISSWCSEVDDGL